MNNRGALWYLILTKLKGSIRNFIRKPVGLVLTLLFSGLFIYMGYRSLKQTDLVLNTFVTDSTLMNISIGLLLYVILIAVIFSKTSALVYENDAIFLFTSPFSTNDTYLYVIVTSILKSLLIAFMFLVYVLVLFNQFILGLPHIIGLILGVFLHFLLLLMIFTYQYIKTAIQAEVRKISKIPIIILSLLMMAMFLISINGQFNLDGLMNISHHPLFKWIPFVGSFGWIANGFVLLDVSALIPVLGLLFLIVVLILKTFNLKGNFIEKAIGDAQVASTIMREAKTRSQVEVVDLKKVKKRNTKVSFLSGGWALFSRQWLVIKKKRSIFPKMMLMIILVYGGIALFTNDLASFRIYIVIGLLFGNDTSLFSEELEKPYIYLIPAHEFTKLLSSLLIQFLRVASVQLINFGLLLYFGESVMDAFIYICFVLSCYLIIIGVDVLLLNLLKRNMNQILKVYLSFIFYVVALIPSGLFISLLVYMFLIQNFNTLLMSTFLINIVVAFIVLFVSKSILKGNNFG